MLFEFNVGGNASSRAETKNCINGEALVKCNGNSALQISLPSSFFDMFGLEILWSYGFLASGISIFASHMRLCGFHK